MPNEMQISCDPDRLLQLLEGRAEPLALRGFAVTCCRGLWSCLDSRARDVVNVVGRYAEGIAPIEALDAARSALGGITAGEAAQAVWYATWRDPYIAAREAAWYAAAATVGRRAAKQAWDAERVRQAHLLREIAGDPLQSAPPIRWGEPVLRLAGELYAGRDVVAGLARALREAGLNVLAEHFAAGGQHPRGCWAMNRILGRR